MAHTIFPDGRKRAYVIPPRNPANVRNSSVRVVIEEFEKNGVSYHSSNATLLQYLVDYCEENKIDYEIQASPGRGYSIKKAKVL